MRYPMVLALSCLLVGAACSGAASSDTSAEAMATPTTTRVPSPATTVIVFEIDDEGYEVRRPVGCAAEPGSPTDLSAEPAHWLAFGDYQRWMDSEGCPVRIDVISHIHGAHHCGWQEAEFITIGIPLGASIASPRSPETIKRYVWNPDGVLDEVPAGVTMASSDLPASVYDTGYRQGGDELWLDRDDDAVLYRVAGDDAQVWTRNSDAGLCR